jgi:alpha-1,2-mannosyltransferase
VCQTRVCLPVTYSHFSSTSFSITSNVRFQINVSNQELRDWLSRAVCGLHTMWCEHFGIGIVELMVRGAVFFFSVALAPRSGSHLLPFQAAGVIPIAHDSGGPRADIVKTVGTVSAGFLASTASQYAEHMAAVLDRLPTAALASMQSLARESAKRFSDEVFDTSVQRLLTQHVAPLLEASKKKDD